MVSMIGSVIQKGQFYMTRISSWKSKSAFEVVVGPYTLRLAQHKHEVLECLRLRHDIFCKELAGRTTKSGLDYDEFDKICDHLMIVHTPTNKIIGTYRLNLSTSSDRFYTASEFEIDDWISSTDQVFIELGRACIHADHRRGIVISLLWRGIAEYMQAVDAEVLLGCSSVKVEDARSAALVMKYLELIGGLKKHLFQVKPKYRMPDFLFWQMVFSQGLNEHQMAEAEEKIPALLKGYLKAGAKVCSYPAYDKDFCCIDFMTLLDRRELDQKIVKKYMSAEKIN